MSLTVTTTPEKTIGSYNSKWTAAHNPIVFKLTSDLFPVETVPVTLTFVSVSESDQGNAVIEWSTNPDLDPVDLAPGRFVKISGSVYSGEFEVIKYDPSNKLELDLSFISTDTGTLSRAFRNYVAKLKVFAGLPAAHKWQSLKPEEEIEIIEQIPGSGGVAVFDIQEAVKQKVNTENDFELESLPNDVNLWTGFRVSSEESYDILTGEEGSAAGITAAGNASGDQEFTVDTDLELVAGDYVILDNFTDSEYNGAVAKVVSDNGSDIVLEIDYNAGLTLNGYETAQKYNINVTSLSPGYTAEGSQYYALNAKLPARSEYGANLGAYLLTDNSGLNIPFLSGFEGKKAYPEKRDEAFLLVDKTFTDSIGNDFSLKVEEKDRNKALLKTTNFEIPNEEEGVYRVNYQGDFLVAFVSLWNTANTSTGSSASDSIQLPLISTGTYNFVVDWGDGTQDTITAWNQAETLHQYSGGGGTKQISISGTIQGWQFNNDGDRNKLLSISNWGSLDINNTNAFNGCENLSLTNVTGTPTLSGDLLSTFQSCSNLTTINNAANWNLSSVSSLFNFFSGCTNMNESGIGSWNVSNVASFRSTFAFCTNFNQDLSNWDVTNATSFRNMFQDATSFNQNLSNWDVSSATTMAGMFSSATAFNNGDASGVAGTMNWTTGASASIFSNMFLNCSNFNQDVNSWDMTGATNLLQMFSNCIKFNNGGNALNWNANGTGTGNVTNFQNTFSNCQLFNVSVANMDVSGALNLSGTFQECLIFNQSLSTWNAPIVTTYSLLVSGASAFNQSLASLAIPTTLTSLNFMLDNCGMSTANYDATLIGWEATVSGQTDFPKNLNLGATGLVYTKAVSSAETARANLITNSSWTFTGDNPTP